MNESKRLYFIPMIATALKSKDPIALREAFLEIVKLGRRPEFKEGFLQFEEFIKAAVNATLETDSSMLRDVVDHLIYDLATDTFDDDEEQKAFLINLLKRFPKWHREYERIREDSQNLTKPNMSMEIEVLREGKLVGSSTMARDIPPIRHIIPGRYTVRLSNGRVLWEGQLTPQDVLWAYAYPAEDLPLAAETERAQVEPTRTISLLDGELEMRVFAGLEAGVMRVESADRE